MTSRGRGGKWVVVHRQRTRRAPAAVEAVFPRLGETATTDDVIKLLAERPH